MEIGLKIKELRNKKNIPVSEIASKMMVTPQAIYNYEQGKNKPSVEVLKKFSEILNVELNELLEINSTNFNNSKSLDEVLISVLKDSNQDLRNQNADLKNQIDYLKGLIDKSEAKNERLLVKY